MTIRWRQSATCQDGIGVMLHPSGLISPSRVPRRKKQVWRACSPPQRAGIYAPVFDRTASRTRITKIVDAVAGEMHVAVAFTLALHVR